VLPRAAGPSAQLPRTARAHKAVSRRISPGQGGLAPDGRPSRRARLRAQQRPLLAVALRSEHTSMQPPVVRC